MNTNDNIKFVVEKLVKKYSSNDPFVLADYLNIRVIYEDYPLELNGVYQFYNKVHSIYINKNLSYEMQRITCGHELGHSRLHKNYNCTFLKTHTFYNTNKFETEANLFCTYLLLPDSALCDYENCTYEQIASAVNLPLDYIKLR